MHVIAAKAVALGIASSEPFRVRQRQTVANAKAYELEVSKTANSFNDKDLVVSIATVSTSYGVVLPSGPSTSSRPPDFSDSA